MKSMKKNRKMIIIISLVLVVAGVGGGLLWRAKKVQEELLAMQNQRITAVAEKRTLVTSISATGKIVSTGTKEVLGNVNGIEILSLPVEVGDTVEAGDLLCEFDQTKLTEDLEEARKSLSTAQQRSQLDIAAAQRNLEDAQTNAQIELQRQDQDLTEAWNDFIKAVQDMEQAKADWDEAHEHTGAVNGEYQYWQQQLNSKESVSLNSLETQKVFYWQGKFESAKQAEIAAEAAYQQAETMVTTKEQTYEKLLRAKEDVVRNQDATLATRNDSLTSSRLNADTSTRTDRQRVEDLEQQLEDCTLLSPVSGVITQIRLQEGDTYTGGALFTIEDVSAFEVSAEIDEYDIGRIREGQKVVIKTNGTGEEELEGKVLHVAPRATVGTGVGSSVTYTVKISVDTPNSLLKMDMTAKLSIIVNQKNNILTVPYEAVQEAEDGSFFVEVVQGETTSKITVEKGIESDYYVEITGGGLAEGSEVVIPSNDDAVLDIQSLLEGQGPMGGF